MYNSEFVAENVTCFGVPNIFLFATSCCIIPLYWGLLITVSFFHYSPVCNSSKLLSSPSGRYNALFSVYLCWQCLVFTYFDTQQLLATVAIAVSSFVLSTIVIIIEPYYRPWINNLEFAFIASFTSSVWMLGPIWSILGWNAPNLLIAGLVVSLDFIAFLAIFFMFIPVFGTINWLRLQLSVRIFYESFRNSAPAVFGNEPPFLEKSGWVSHAPRGIAHYYLFRLLFFVFPRTEPEIAIRYLYEQPVAEPEIDLEADSSGAPHIERAEHVFVWANRLAPNSVPILLAYYQFLLLYGRDVATCNEGCKVLRKRKLWPDHAYSLYVLSEITRVVSLSQNQGQEAELVRAITTLRKMENRCRKAQVSYWESLSRSDVDMFSIPQQAKDLEALSLRTHQEYLRTMPKYPKSVQLLRMYGTFLAKLLNESEQSEEILRKADEMEQVVLTSEAQSEGSSAGKEKGTKIRQYKEFRESINGMNRASLKKTTIRMLVAMAIFVALLTVMAGAQRYTVTDSQYRATSIYNVAHLLLDTNKEYVYLLRMIASVEADYAPGTTQSALNLTRSFTAGNVSETADEMKESAMTLYLHDAVEQWNGPYVDYLWQEKWVNLRLWDAARGTADPKFEEVHYSLWDAIRLLYTEGRICSAYAAKENVYPRG
ncbi:hypothetical protein HOL82_03415, partial [Candidatus Woesearchaeota archaeon]|nr:hypothetical protein [Candidatus Woesearchaeota archaeon]